MILIFLGAPGSGKGTVSTKLKNEYGWIPISTGDIFRENIKNETSLGIKAKKLVESGNLVTDDITNEMFKDKFSSFDFSKNYIFDGYPRSLNQIDFLNNLFNNVEKLEIKVIYFEANENILVKRISGRLVCPDDGSVYHKTTLPPNVEGICNLCGTELIKRKDDEFEKIAIRISEYKKKTFPIIEEYKKNSEFIVIDANRNVDESLKELLEKIK